jgi:hypothetical protein
MIRIAVKTGLSMGGLYPQHIEVKAEYVVDSGAPLPGYRDPLRIRGEATLPGYRAFNFAIPVSKAHWYRKTTPVKNISSLPAKGTVVIHVLLRVSKDVEAQTALGLKVIFALGTLTV